MKHNFEQSGPFIGVGGLVVALFLYGYSAIALPGIVNGKRYTYAWSTLLVTGYVALALTEIVANAAQRGIATLMLLVAFALFVALVAYLRVSRTPGSAG